jgi:hypothetical protein
MAAQKRLEGPAVAARQRTLQKVGVGVRLRGRIVSHTTDKPEQVVGPAELHI